MKYLILTFLLLGFLNINAQDKKEPTYTRVGADYQYNFAKMGELNATLSGSGFEPLNEYGDYFNFYIKSGKASSKWMSTFGFSYYQRQNATTRNNVTPINTADIIGFGVSSGAEYRLIDSKYFFLNPLFSLDFEYYKLAFAKNIASTSLGEILQADIETFSASSLQVSIRIGIRTGVNIPIKERSLSLGFTAGYKWHYANKDWRINDTVLVGSPVNLSSLFAGVSLEIAMFPGK